MAWTVKMNTIQRIKIWENQCISESENGLQSKNSGIQMNQYSLEFLHQTKQTGGSSEDG